MTNLITDNDIPSTTSKLAFSFSTGRSKGSYNCSIKSFRNSLFSCFPQA